MITNIDKETIDFLAKKGLTFNQFCMLLLIHQQDIASIIKYSDKVGYLTGGTIMKPDKRVVNELKDLIDRGYLRYIGVDNDVYSLDNYTVTEKFTKGFLDTFQDMARELFKEYPSTIAFKDEVKPVAKSVDYDEFEEKYIKVLKEDLEHHKRAMAWVKAYKVSNKHAPIGIMKFIGSRHWENAPIQNNATPFRFR